MPRKAREFLELRYLADMALSQITLLLGTSISATKMRLCRALSLGQRILDGKRRGASLNRSRESSFDPSSRSFR